MGPASTPSRGRVLTALFLLPVSMAASHAAAGGLEIRFLGRHSTGSHGQSAAEMPTFDPASARLFVVNGGQSRLDVLDIRKPATPRALDPIDLRPYGGEPTCVTSHGGVVAITVPNRNKTLPGSVVFFDASGRLLAQVTVGALPDMLAFTPDGTRLVVANEGEPRDYCAPGLANDPEGSVSIIDLTQGVAGLGQDAVRTVGFGAFTRSGLDPRIRIAGPNVTVAQDLEPEYVAISADSRTAFVVLQENNAIAVVDLLAAEVTRLMPLGTKDHNRRGQGLDPSDRDGAIRIGPWPVRGMYQPDGIVTYEAGGQTFLLTANEGDARNVYECFNDEVRVGSLRLDPQAFPEPTIQEEARLGRLNVSRVDGDADGDGQYETLYAFGARSFSIWSDDGSLVFDSGHGFEDTLSRELPDSFNADNASPDSFDSRSDDRGPEPEGIAIGKVGDRTYVFVGLERPSGVMVYDVTRPEAPSLVQYVHSRQVQDSSAAEDVGPEGVLFVPAVTSPTGQALLVVANEISGTVALYSLTP